MTTRSFSSVCNSSTTAEFRALFKELSDELKAAGLVQTTDTGQINWATVNLPALNTMAGYEIFRFSDLLQATAPVFIKIEYGMGSTSRSPGMYVTVGSTTNGAGVIGSTILNGSTTGRQVCTWMKNPDPAYGGTYQNIQYPSKICVKDGYLIFAFKIGALQLYDSRSYPNVQGFLMVARTVDQTNGANTGEGVVMYRMYGESLSLLGHVSHVLNFNTGKVFPPSGFNENHTQVYFDVASSIVEGTKVQLYRHLVSLPRTDFTHYIATYLNPEIPALTTFDATLVGSTPHTYLALGYAGVGSGSNRNIAHSNVVMFE